MNELVVAIASIALVALGVYLWRLVARDGYGSTPTPRSHREDVGTWIDRELQR